MQNLQGGAKYLKYLLELYHGDPTLALAAYNAGEQAVAHYGGVPPYPETQKYVIAVKQIIAPKAPVLPSAPAAKPASNPANGNHVIEVRQPDGTVRYLSRQEPL